MRYLPMLSGSPARPDDPGDEPGDEPGDDPPDATVASRSGRLGTVGSE